MIRQLKLESFGKFKNRVFDLAGLQLFLGKNESGKSTLFDALLLKIANVRGNNTEAKRINSRYNGEKGVELEGDIPENVELDEFLNLHCLKSGEIGIDFTKEKWVDSIKRQLFSGGIDPRSIAQELERVSGTRSTLTHNKRIREKEEEIDRLKEEVEALLVKKKELIRQEESLESSENQKQSLTEELKTKEKILQEKTANLQREESVRSKRKLRDLYKSLVQRKTYLQEMNSLKPFSDDKLQEINRLEKEILTLKEKISHLEAVRKTSEERIQESKTKIQEAEENFQKSYPQENLARSIKDRLEENIRNPYRKEMVSYEKLYLVLGAVSGVLGLLGFILWVIRNYPMEFLLAGVGFFLVGGGLFLFSRKKSMVSDTEKVLETVNRYKLEWKEWEKSESMEDYNSFQSMRDYFFQYLSTRKRDSEIIQEKRAILGKLEAEWKETQEKLTELQKNLKTKQEDWEAIFRKLQITDKEEFMEKSKKLFYNTQAIKNLEERIRTQEAEMDWEDLFIEIERKLADLDREGIPDKGMEDPEFEETKKIIRNLTEDIRETEAKLKNLELMNMKSKTSVKTQLQPINLTLFEKQNRLFQVEKDLVKDRDRLTATRECKEIFDNLAEESDDILTALSEEIQESTGNFFPGLREIRIQDLKGNISMQDQGGEFRSIQDLSLGTRDCFYIAAKLTLCEKNNPDLKLFIMDEPFAGLDEDRSKMLIRMMHHYVKEKGWQILVFSKDFRLRDYFEETGGDHLSVTELS